MLETGELVDDLSNCRVPLKLLYTVYLFNCSNNMVINKKAGLKSSLCLIATPYGRGSRKMHTLYCWALDGPSLLVRFILGRGGHIRHCTWA